MSLAQAAQEGVISVEGKLVVVVQ